MCFRNHPSTEIEISYEDQPNNDYKVGVILVSIACVLQCAALMPNLRIHAFDLPQSSHILKPWIR